MFWGTIPYIESEKYPIDIYIWNIETTLENTQFYE